MYSFICCHWLQHACCTSFTNRQVFNSLQVCHSGLHSRSTENYLQALLQLCCPLAVNGCLICFAGHAQAFYPVAGGPLWFGLPITSITNSLVTINVVADNLELVTNESPGKILSAQVRLTSAQLPSL